MEAPLGHSRLSPEVWKEIFAHLPMLWRAMCCRVCKVWQKDFEQPRQGHGDGILVDYGLATLCCVLATKGVDEVMRRIRLHYPSGIAADLGRMDQVRRFVLRHRGAETKSVDERKSVDEWMQLASQEPDAGWLHKGVSKTMLEGMGKSWMRQVGGNSHFSKLVDMWRASWRDSYIVHRVSWSSNTIAFAVYGCCAVWLLDAKTMEVKDSVAHHRKGASYVDYSKDGKYIATAGEDTMVQIWDAENKHMCSLRGHSGTVSSVAWSPNGEMIASGSKDMSVRLWSKSGEHKGTLRGHSADNSACTCDHFRTSVDSDEDDDYNRWYQDNFGLILHRNCPVKGHIREVTSVVWSPDGEIVASVSEDKSIHLCNKLGERKGVLGHTEDNPHCICKHWDDLDFFEDHGRFHVNPECRVTGHSDRINDIAFSPDSSTIASASYDQTVIIWDAEYSLRGYTGTPESSLQALAAIEAYYEFDLGETFDAYWDIDKDGVVSLENLETALGKFQTGMSSEHIRELHKHLMQVGSCDGGGVTKDAWLEAVAAADSSAVAYNPTASRVKSTLTGHSGAVYSVAWSPDGQTIVSGGRDGTVRLWSKSGEHKGTLTGHMAAVNSVTFSPDSQFVASGSGEVGNRDNSIRIWEVATGKVCSPKGHSDWVICVAHSPNGKRIASASFDGTVIIWDTVTMEEVGTLRGHSDRVWSVAWNHDGSQLASGSSDGTVRLWTPDGKEKGTLRGHSDRVRGVAYSPDRRRIASASDDKTVKVWDAATMEEVGTLRGHSDCVNCIAYSPDSKSLASASWDNTVKLWDLSGETPVEKGTLKGHGENNPECTCSAEDDWYGEENPECPVTGHYEAVSCVAYSHDGSTIASASLKDQRVIIWDAGTMEKVCLLKGYMVSWQHLDPGTKALAAKGQHFVIGSTDGKCDMVYVYRNDSDGEQQEEPLAWFRSPTHLTAVSCKGTSVVVGCKDGQVLFLEAPGLADS